MKRIIFLLVTFAALAGVALAAGLSPDEKHSARLGRDTRHNLPAGGFFDLRRIKIPVAVGAFAEEIYQAPKSWADVSQLIQYNRFHRGTHFAAWELPESFSAELRAGFRSLR